MAELGLGHAVHIRVDGSVIESIDTIRLDHVLQFAREKHVLCPTLEWLADHPDGDQDLPWEALVEEMQKLAQARAPDRLAPIMGLLRNDATRAAHIAQTSHAA